MNWDDLRILCAVREFASYSGAARHLGMDETTVSRRLSRLQRDLGAALFQPRDGKRIPTPICNTLLAKADLIAATVEDIKALCRSDGDPIGRVRISTTALIAEDFLARDLDRFLTDNPGISLEIHTSNENVRFSNWETDLAIRLARPEQGNFQIRKLGSLGLALVYPKTWTEGTFKAQRIVSYPDSLSWTPETTELRSRFPDAQVALMAGELSLLWQALASGQVAGVLPDYKLGSLRQRTDLVIEPIAAFREAWLLIQPHLMQDPATRRVIDWVYQCHREIVT